MQQALMLDIIIAGLVSYQMENRAETLQRQDEMAQVTKPKQVTLWVELPGRVRHSTRPKEHRLKRPSLLRFSLLSHLGASLVSAARELTAVMPMGFKETKLAECQNGGCFSGSLSQNE